MAVQLVGDQGRCQRLMHCAANHGGKGSYGYHRIRNLRRTQPDQDNYFKEHNIIGREKDTAKHCTNSNRGRQQAQKLHMLGFSYLASSFRYIMTKVKAFYNGFLADVASESRMGVEVPMAEPYFSIPVLPN